MIITNNTEKQSVYYSISCPGLVDCGNLAPNQEIVLSSYDNKAKVKLTFSFAKVQEEMSILLDDAAG